MNAQPLEGITVLDFGQVYNGPYCGFLLAQAGARVIKVESLIGETLRARGQGTPGSYAFSLLNSNKESITLNIKSKEGQALLKELAKAADVVLENFAPGTMDRYGIGAEALRAVNPRLVYASSTGYGSVGPHRDYLGMDITLQAMTGVMSITGEEGDRGRVHAGLRVSHLGDRPRLVLCGGRCAAAAGRQSSSGPGACALQRL